MTSEGTEHISEYLRSLASNLKNSLDIDPKLFAEIVSRNLNELNLHFTKEIDSSPLRQMYKEFEELLSIIRERAMRLTDWRPTESLNQEPQRRKPEELQQDSVSEASIDNEWVSITKEEAKAFKILRQYHDHLISIVQSKPESKLYSQLLERQKGVITDYLQDFTFPPSAQEGILFKYEDILSLTCLPKVLSDSLDYIPNPLEKPATPEPSLSPKKDFVEIANPKIVESNEGTLVVSGIPNWTNRCDRMEKNLKDIDSTMKIFLDERSANMELTRANFEKYASHSLEYKFGNETRPEITRASTITDPNKALLGNLTKNMPFFGKFEHLIERTPTGRIKKSSLYYKTLSNKAKQQAKEWGKRTEAKIIKNFAELDIKKKKFVDEEGNRLSRRDISWNNQKPSADARIEVLAKYNMDIGINEIKTSKRQKKAFGSHGYLQTNSSLLPPADQNLRIRSLNLNNF
jgi:hypothetical protein